MADAAWRKGTITAIIERLISIMNDSLSIGRVADGSNGGHIECFKPAMRHRDEFALARGIELACRVDIKVSADSIWREPNVVTQ